MLFKALKLWLNKRNKSNVPTVEKDLPKILSVDDYLEEVPLIKNFSHVIIHRKLESSDKIPCISISGVGLKLRDDGVLHTSIVDPVYMQNLNNLTMALNYAIPNDPKSPRVLFTKNIPDTIPATELFYKPSMALSQLTKDMYVLNMCFGKSIVFLYGDYKEFYKYKDITIIYFMTVINQYMMDHAPDVDKQLWDYIKPRFGCAVNHCMRKMLNV